eukprot:TRINITY_DN47896_c0_g1_i1.p1 TRINITY_DN47896_c0_g1~~TRINITY_DN47896_c0_g1_i1.p1  ORF type:complete len:307 (+),score=57.82 TRINITY_DN47896_c0_g1_i1:109-1029(+)
MAKEDELAKVCLPVPKIPDEIVRQQIINGPPRSAEEYLARVRYQNKRMADVFVSEISDAKREELGDQTSKQTVKKPSPAKLATSNIAASPRWKRHVASSFTDLRQYLFKCASERSKRDLPTLPHLPRKRATEEWLELCFGKDDKPGYPPSTNLISAIDQPFCRTILKLHVDRLETQEYSLEAAAWLYALMARLDKPVPSGTTASLRYLYRILSDKRIELVCCRFFYDMVANKCNISVFFVQHEDPEILASINTLMCIVTHVFSQRDLLVESEEITTDDEYDGEEQKSCSKTLADSVKETAKLDDLL